MALEKVREIELLCNRLSPHLEFLYASLDDSDRYLRSLSPALVSSFGGTLRSLANDIYRLLDMPPFDGLGNRCGSFLPSPSCDCNSPRNHPLNCMCVECRHYFGIDSSDSE